MKHIQLFKSWLNEEQKQFNKDKPRETPVLQLLQKDLYAAGKARRTRWAMLSMLSRSLQKNKDKFDPESDTVSMSNNFQLKGVEDALITLKTEGDDDSLSVKMNAKKGAVIKALEWIGAEISGDDLTKSCIVTVVKDVDAAGLYSGKREEIISTKVGTVVFMPNKPKKPDDLAIDMPIVVVAQDKAKLVSLGQLCAYASTKFTDFTTLEKKETGTKEALAKGVLKGEGGTEEKKA